MKPKNDMIPNARVLNMALQVGFSTAITATAFILGGRALDQRFETTPLFSILGIILGLTGSLYLVYEIVHQFFKKNKK